MPVRDVAPVDASLDLGPVDQPKVFAVSRDPAGARDSVARAARAYATALHAVAVVGGSEAGVLRVPGVPGGVAVPEPAWAVARAAAGDSEGFALGIDTYERVEGPRVYVAMFFASARLANDQVEAYCSHVYVEAQPSGGVLVGVEQLNGVVLVAGTSRKTTRVRCPHGPLEAEPQGLS